MRVTKVGKAQRPAFLETLTMSARLYIYLIDLYVSVKSIDLRRFNGGDTDEENIYFCQIAVCQTQQ